MKTKEFLDINHDACGDGKAFALKYKNMHTVWNNCERPDWMFWILRRMKVEPDKKTLRLYACWCVRNTPLKDGRTTWGLLKDPRSRNAIEVSERFAAGQATEQERSYAYAASASAASAYATCAAYAASDAASDATAAATYAAYAASDAAYAASAYAAYAASDAATYATYAASASAASAYAACAAYAASDAATYATYAAYAAYAASAARNNARRAQCKQLRKMIANPFVVSK